MQFWHIATIYLVFINLLTFAIYGMDKKKAKQKKWRITERALITLAFIGGGIGAILGMLSYRHKTKKNKFRVLVPLALVLTILFITFFTYQNNHLETTEYAVEIGVNCKIVQLSDVHNLTVYWNKDAIVNYVKDLNPDYIVITGDLVDSIHTDIDAAIYTAGELSQIAPTYYVTGNHEMRLASSSYTTFISRLKETGVIVLDNEYVTLEDRDGMPFALIGLDDRNLGDDTLTSITSTIDPLLPTVLLAHEPEYLDNYSNAGIDLALSGHLHGGQIIFGNRHNGQGRGLVTPDFDFFADYSYGKSSLGDTTIITSRGIGNSIIPFRINNLPEIVVIDLT